jgi:hypothetical protein
LNNTKEQQAGSTTEEKLALEAQRNSQLEVAQRKKQLE